MIQAAVVLIVLHGADGKEVTINADQVTSLRSKSVKNAEGHFTAKAECMISLTDGKFVAVIEDCEIVQQAIKKVH